MKLGRLGGVALAAVLSGGMPLAHAQLLPECIVSATSVNFGAYNPFSPVPLDGVGEVRVGCKLLGLLPLDLIVNYSVSLSAGSSGVFSGRQMVSAGNRLNYNLYTGASRISVWGNGSGGSSTVSDSYLLSLIVTTRSYSIYGRIPPGQNLPAGAYTETIVVTVDY